MKEKEPAMFENRLMPTILKAKPRSWCCSAMGSNQLQACNDNFVYSSVITHWTHKHKDRLLSGPDMAVRGWNQANLTSAE